MKKVFCGMVVLALTACAPLTASTSRVESSPSATPADGAATPVKIIFGSCQQKPVYPQAARDEKRQGTVVLAFQVDIDNTVMESKVTRSSGHADLDEAARVGLAKCKFQAATRNGLPVRQWADVQYNWTP